MDRYRQILEWEKTLSPEECAARIDYLIHHEPLFTVSDSLTPDEQWLFKRIETYSSSNAIALRGVLERATDHQEHVRECSPGKKGILMQQAQYDALNQDILWAAGKPVSQQTKSVAGTIGHVTNYYKILIIPVPPKDWNSEYAKTLQNSVSDTQKTIESLRLRDIENDHYEGKTTARNVRMKVDAQIENLKAPEVAKYVGYVHALKVLAYGNAAPIHYPENPEVVYGTNISELPFTYALFQQWAQGKPLHKEIAFRSAQTKAEFEELLTNTLSYCLADSQTPKQQAEDTGRISRAVHAYVARMREHDKELEETKILSREEIDRRKAQYQEEGLRRAHGREAILAERRAQEEAARETAAAEARALEQRQRAEHVEYMAKHQPYPIEKDAAASSALSHMQKHAESTAGNALQAKLAGQLVTEQASLLDIRQSGMKQLGNLMLSHANLGALAVALSFGKALSNAERNAQVSATTKQLRTLYTAPAVKAHVDAMLHDEKAVMLVALLTRADTACLSYANRLATILKEREHLQLAITQAEQALASILEEFTPAEQAELCADMSIDEVKNLAELRKKLSNKTSEFSAIHKSFAEQVHQVIIGRRPRSVASNVADESSEVEAGEKKAPDTWKVSDEIYAHATFEFVHDDKHWLRVSSREFPEKSFEIKANAPKAAFEKELKTLQTSCEQYRANMAVMADLQENYGFEFCSEFLQPGDTAKALLLKHPEYDISVVLDGKDADISAALAAAQDRFDARKTQQASLLRMLEEEGVNVTKTPSGGLSLTYNGDEPIAAAPRGYLSSVDFSTAHTLLDRLHPLEAPGEMVPDAPPPAAPWPPTEKDTLLIFDTNVLHKLAAVRSCGRADRTWLDILEQTAKLPNVKIIIPEVVAQWEMLGRIPNYNAQGEYTGTTQIRNHFADPEHVYNNFAAPMRRLVENAAHAHIGADGKVTFKPGKNSNIIVMGTDNDREFYRRINDIHRKKEYARFDREIYGHDEGEKAINRIIDALVWPCSTLVVSDDMHYLFDRNKADTIPQKTRLDKPVHYAGSGAYLEAELKVRGRATQLRQAMHESRPITLSRIDDDIDALTRTMKSNSRPLMMHAAYAPANGHASHSHIDHLLQCGVHQLQQSQQSTKAPSTNGRPPACAPAPSVHGPAASHEMLQAQTAQQFSK